MYEQLLDLNNLYWAFNQCKKNVAWKYKVQQFEANLLPNLLALKTELETDTYKQGKFHEFEIHFRGKTRNIKALQIRDRIVHRVLCDKILFPAVQKHLIWDNGACIKGKGISFTRRRFQQHLLSFGNEGYCLKIDIKDYYNSIARGELVVKHFSKYIKDDRVLSLMKLLLSQYGNEAGIGGQLYQLIGAFYLTPIDILCKVKLGVKCYDRYLDDIIILVKTKKEAEVILEQVEKKLIELKLEVNRKKTKIYSIKHGILFLKYTWLFKNKKLLKIPSNETFTREKKKLDKISESEYRAWRGNLRKLNCYHKLKHIDRSFYDTGRKRSD